MVFLCFSYVFLWFARSPASRESSCNSSAASWPWSVKKTLIALQKNDETCRLVQISIGQYSQYRLVQVSIGYINVQLIVRIGKKNASIGSTPVRIGYSCIVLGNWEIFSCKLPCHEKISVPSQETMDFQIYASLLEIIMDHPGNTVTRSE